MLRSTRLFIRPDHGGTHEADPYYDGCHCVAVHPSHGSPEEGGQRHQWFFQLGDKRVSQPVRFHRNAKYRRHRVRHTPGGSPRPQEQVNRFISEQPAEVELMLPPRLFNRTF